MIDLIFRDLTSPFINEDNLNEIVDQINTNESNINNLQTQISAIILAGGSGSVLFEEDGETALASANILDSLEAIDENVADYQIAGAKAVKSLKDSLSSIPKVKTDTFTISSIPPNSEKYYSLATFGGNIINWSCEMSGTNYTQCIPYLASNTFWVRNNSASTVNITVTLKRLYLES